MPRQVPPSNAVFARGADPRTTSASAFELDANGIAQTVAACGHGSGSAYQRADLLVCDDVVDVSALHSHTDCGRVAEYFENNLLNLLEPEGRFWSLLTSRSGDDFNARQKKKSAFGALPRAD